MMTQGVLPFQYQEEKTSTGMTALAGLPTYLDLAQVAGLSQSIERHVKLREGNQGWSDSQIITSLGAGIKALWGWRFFSSWASWNSAR